MKPYAAQEASAQPVDTTRCERARHIPCYKYHLLLDRERVKNEKTAVKF